MFDEEAERLLESLPGPVMAVDLDGEVVAANESTAVVMGRPREELTATTLSELEAGGVLGEGASERYRAALAELQDGSGGDETTFEVDVHLGGDSPPRPFEVQLAVHRDDGDVRGTVWSLSSVDLEERYDETIEALHSATRTLMGAETTDEAFEICGRAANEILGFPGTGVRRYDPEAEVLEHVSFGGRVENIEERPPFDVEDSPHGEAFRTGETVVEAVPDEDDPYDREVFSHTMYVPIGEYGVLSLGKMRGSFDDADVRFAEILARNTAAALESIEQRERLVEQRRELERQNERLDEFASIVAHDLENPISLARGSIEAYLDTGDESLAENAISALDRLETTVEEVLALARQGRTVEEVEPVDLAEAATQAWATVDAGDADLTVPEELTVAASRNPLLRLLENLFTNAVEHGDAEEVVVEPIPEGFAVADDGSGVPVDDREAVFESGHTTSEEGSGLGLVIVEDIAAAHGWSVSLEESEAGGARFEVTGVDVDDGYAGE